MDEQLAPRSADDARGFFDRWLGCSNGGDWSGLSELMHSDIVIADPMTPEPSRGRTESVARVRAQYEPFPDGHVDMLGQPFVSVGEPELAYRWRFAGTHRRPVAPPGFAATGRRVVLDGTSVLRFQDGKVIEVNLFFDTTDVARQLLAAPAAGSPLERVMVVSQRARARLARRRSS